MAKHRGNLELTWTDKDKALLSAADGRYDYTFVDRSDYRVSEVRLLREVGRIEADSLVLGLPDLPSPTNDNLLITGDAMHVLDALAKIPEYSGKYLRKVKLVYIDPPFNTGLAFPHYEDNIEHSIWLTMLRDRLRQIVPLLAEGGSVWVHLDDVEVHRCRLVMDEELGPENFVAEVAWRKRTSVADDSATFTAQHDVILVYAKNKPSVTINRLPRALTKDDLRYKSVDGDPRPWGTFGNISAPENLSGKRQRPSVYAIQHPLTGEMIYPPRGRHWIAGTDRVRAALNEYAEFVEVQPDIATRCAETGFTPKQVRTDVPDLVLADPEAARETAQRRIDEGCWPEFFVQEKTFGRKTYQAEHRTSPPSTWWSDIETGHNRESKSEIKALFPGINPFSTPKPERLLQRIIRIATDRGDIVLDCFAGSGTTAAVAQKMGRRWVACELQNETVDTFTKPRLTRVVEGNDPGGVTSVTERVAAVLEGSALPDGMTPDEAYEFNRLLSRIVTTDGLAPDEATIATLRSATRTRNVTNTRWHGGGGFTHLEVCPSMFTEVDGMILLAEWAVHGALARAMCAQLNVRYRTDGIFVGKRGRTRYVVIDGMVGEGTTAAILDRLPSSQTVEVWATQIEAGAPDVLRRERPGSSLNLIPDAVLDNYRRKASRASPFSRKRATAIEGTGS